MSPCRSENHGCKNQESDVRRKNSSRPSKVEWPPIPLKLALFAQMQQDAGNQVPAQHEEKIHSHPQHRDVKRVRCKHHQDCNSAEPVQLGNSSHEVHSFCSMRSFGGSAQPESGES